MNYEGILEFKGTWRKYQARVLEHADRYISMEKYILLRHPVPEKRPWELK